MNKIKSFFRRKGAQVGTALVAVTSVLPMAGAAGSEPPTVSTSGVVTAITTAAESVKTDALTVIGVAVGVGIVFWSARVLWSKFRGMAK